ncbi:hypothetical protein ACTXT7_002643 [Hymenolepis weldensis]
MLYSSSPLDVECQLCVSTLKSWLANKFKMKGNLSYLNIHVQNYSGSGGIHCIHREYNVTNVV